MSGSISLNLAFHKGNWKNEGNQQIITSITVADGGVSFLGTVEDPKKDTVELIFLRATLSQSAQ